MTTAGELPDAPTGTEHGAWRRFGGRLWSGLATLWVAVTGLAPHVLHHAGPLAGAAIVSGALGTSLFAAVGFVATVPLLLRLRRRFGSWKVPGLALVLFAAVFTFSTVVLGPLVAGGDETDSAPTTEQEHEEHHP
jgi:hypothetical protein